MIDKDMEVPSEQPQDFDEISYDAAFAVYDDILKARLIGISDAAAIAQSMVDGSDIFRASLKSLHAAKTLELLTRLVKLKRTASNGAMVDVIPSFAQSILLDLNSSISENPEANLIPAYSMANTFSETNNTVLATLATGIYVDNLDRLLESRDLSKKDADSIIKQIIANANPEQLRILVKEAITPGSPLLRRFPSQMESVLNLSLLGNNTYERPARMKVVLDEITGGQSQKLLDAWDDSEGKRKDRTKASESIYFDNFSAICYLEKRRPGIIKTLIDEYRILSVARYPMDLLIEQYDKRGERDTPYGVIVSARHDYNGAVYSQKAELEQAFKQTKSLGYGLKVFEAEDSKELAQSVHNFAENHGKLSYMILIAHGDPDFIALGGEDSYSRAEALGKVDFSKDLNQIGDAFEPSASIGLISCYGGIKNGLAQALSSELKDIEIHSADYKAYLRKLGIQFEKVDGKLVMRILFGYNEGNYNTAEDILHGLSSDIGGALNIRTYTTNDYDIATRVYRNGELVRDYSK